MTTTLRELIERYGGMFVIPAYQRRYVWGQERPGECDSAARLMHQIIDNYQNHRGPYFLQGITIGGDTSVSSDAKAPHPGGIIIDGQQRLTFIVLLLKRLEFGGKLSMRYDCRPAAQQFINTVSGYNHPEESDGDTQDEHFMRKSIRTIDNAIDDIDRQALLDYVLDNITFMVIEVPDTQKAITAFRMINGTKSPMLAPDIIKADIMRMVTAKHESQNGDANWQIDDLRTRYATEWEEWVRWWHRPDVAEYYSLCSTMPMELLINLCLMDDDDAMAPLTYERFRQAVGGDAKASPGKTRPADVEASSTNDGPGDTKVSPPAQFFYQLRCTQRRFVEAYNDSTTYNRIQAIILLQDGKQRYEFLHHYFVDMDIDTELLEKCYKLSFLGMKTTQILRGDSPEPYFQELLATVGLSDVYHNTQAKAEVFKLLLRLNIDEDIKLGRRFDFSVWNNRSLEHIYSKSKVWHRDQQGHVCDGNDNDLRTTPQKINQDPSFMHRGLIVNHDGMQLSEHCVGNLVLLYGQNNADFGNATFDQKKLMFLTPGGMTVFRSRNLLHSVCVFAAKDWTARSIVDNYNLTLKNLKQYYGYK